MPYGVVIMEEDTRGFNGTKKVLMHEMGHAVGAGWRDDKGPGHVAECYSGVDCQGTSRVGISVGLGEDPTSEYISSPRGGRTGTWSIMTKGFSAELFGRRLAFSLEEVSTIDTSDIPSRDD